MVWVGGLEGERGSGEADQGEHNLALPRIVESRPEHLKILKIHLQGVPQKMYWNDAGAMVHILNHQAVIGTTWAWKVFFWSFLTMKKQDQAPPIQVHGKI